MNEKTVLAIDPGTSKCGMAVVERNEKGELKILWRKIAPTASISEAMSEAIEVAPFSLVVVGSATHSRPIVQAVRDKWAAMAILTVDERDTSLQARERYWEHNPRRGWRRLLPSTLQVPPEPVDDFVAFILAERVLSAD